MQCCLGLGHVRRVALEPAIGRVRAVGIGASPAAEAEELEAAARLGVVAEVPLAHVRRLVTRGPEAVTQSPPAARVQPRHLGIVAELGKAVREAHVVLPGREASEQRRPRRHARHR